ncbi:MAG: hypothetical protein JWO04_4121 [Gammaproteobacteria bacterium]|nr:hypothetical protein [Gammaproteobacteria bacterium]
MLPEQRAAVATAVPVAEPTSGTLQHEAATAPQCANWEERVCNPDYDGPARSTLSKLAVLSFTYLICAAITLAVTGAYSIYAT